jgi:hypothetical protein
VATFRMATPEQAANKIRRAAGLFVTDGDGHVE